MVARNVFVLTLMRNELLIYTFRFIIVDLPPEEAGGFVSVCRKQGLTYVPLVTPTTANGKNNSISGDGPLSPPTIHRCFRFVCNRKQASTNYSFFRPTSFVALNGGCICLLRICYRYHRGASESGSRHSQVP